MKTIKTVFSVALIAMIMALTSCGNKANTTADNPAEEFVASLDKITKEIKSFNSDEDFQKIQPLMEAADKIVTDNSTYELNDNDREAIKEALSNFYRAAMTKSFEIAKQEISDDELNGMVSMITASVNDIKTLGQLNQAPSSNGALEFSESEVVESVEDMSDDSGWEKAEKKN
ncbi:MAG: hypothetical protein K2J10_03855 [Muribaculaceae bacterium]|nr:hypothetical protein [Muribaculaceae bacterium]